MIESYPYTTIVLCLGLIVYIWVMLRVGSARAKFKISAPVMMGPVEFERVVRVHGNTLEQLALFIPSLLLFAAAWGDSPAAILGILWPVGRVIYALRYYAGVNRSLGFGLGFIASAVMLAGALLKALMSVL
jgi:glutathione S-transferase